MPALAIGSASACGAWIGVALITKGLGDVLIPTIGITFGGMIGNLGLVVAMLTAGFICRQVLTRLSQRRTASLRDVPDEDQFAVSLQIKREVTYAHDEGLLTIADGWLVYEGRHCAFSLRSCDVLSVFSWDPYVRLDFIGPHNRQTLTFRGSDRERLASMLKEWKDGPIAAGEPIFPPVTPDASAFTLARLSIGVGTFLLLGALFALTNSTRDRMAVAFLASCLAGALLIYGEGIRQALHRIESGAPFKKSPLLGIGGSQFAAEEEIRRQAIK